MVLVPTHAASTLRALKNILAASSKCRKQRRFFTSIEHVAVKGQFDPSLKEYLPDCFDIYSPAEEWTVVHEMLSSLVCLPYLDS